MGILDTFLYLQPGLFLSETLEVCPAQEARFYIEADNCNVQQTQEMLQMSPKQTITNQRVQFFRVRHVANALIQTNRPFLFLKVLLAPSYTLEATVHRAIDQLCRPHTPNLIVTHYVRVVDEGLFTLQYMLLEYGNSLKLNLIGLGSLCDYTEFETTLFSCFFQSFHAIGILHAYHFQHRDVDAAPPEQLERGCRRDLEERRRRAQVPVGEEPVGQHPKFVDDPGQLRCRDRLAVDREPLFHAHEVRRGVAARPVPCRRQGRGGHRADRALAVGARDNHARARVLRAVQRVRDGADVLEAELVAVELEAEEVLKRIHA